MDILILIPGLICVFVLFRWPVEKVFQNVFLPILLMFPTYYFWKVASLPPVTLADAVLLPLGLAAVIKYWRQWRLSPMDVWIGVFVFTTQYADSLLHHDTASTFELFAALCTALMPYILGKLLIEQTGQRIPTAKRIVFCLFLASIFSAYEYRMGRNPYSLIMERILPQEQFGWFTQIRWGFGRVAGPFGQSELAGMVFFTGLVLALWLSYYNLWEPKFSRAPWLPGRKARVIAWVLGVTVLMTQARGPWIGALIALPVAMIGRSKRMLRTALLVGVFGILGSSVLYVTIKHYTSGPVTNQDQENATYRAHLVEHYLPIVMQGGPWGLGPTFPRQAGQDSVDNEYLFVALTQGFVGIGMFALICLESLGNLVYTVILTPEREDKYFVFSMLGIMLGIMFVLFTVFLGNQSYLLFFMLVGWSEALRFKPVRQRQLSFQQVYT